MWLPYINLFNCPHTQLAESMLSSFVFKFNFTYHGSESTSWFTELSAETVNFEDAEFRGKGRRACSEIAFSINLWISVFEDVSIGDTVSQRQLVVLFVADLIENAAAAMAARNAFGGKAAQVLDRIETLCPLISITGQSLGWEEAFRSKFIGGLLFRLQLWVLKLFKRRIASSWVFEYTVVREKFTGSCIINAKKSKKRDRNSGKMSAFDNQ